MAEIKRKDVSTARREMTREELERALAEAREEEFRLRFRRATETIDNTNRFRALRRDIARIQTVLREKQAHG
ncbi:MAG TPA: 50S ribosomal protein L29 [Gemmatimonadales bacterium]|nr:50S ribosomal protein L29 [Gemmatimonadales bacterium]